MVNTDAQFDKAVKIVRELPPDGPYQPSQEEQLDYYAHYKQATEGDCDESKPPGMFDFKGKAKHKAWVGVKGMSKEDAKAQYVALLKGALQKANDEKSKEYLQQLEEVGN